MADRIFGAPVATPGFESYDPGAVSLTAPEGNHVAVVLETYDAAGASVRYFNGQLASVLLVNTLSVLEDVIIPVAAGGGATSTLSWAPRPTAPDLLAIVKAGLQTDGGLPSPSFPDPRWGSRVVVSFLGEGVPYISGYLPHQSLSAKRSPRLLQRTGVADTAAASAARALRASDPEIPDSLADAERVPRPRVPATVAGDEAAEAAYLDAYVAGWLAGAEAGYQERASRSGDDDEPTWGGRFETAQADGWARGWADGQKAAARELSKNPPLDDLGAGWPAPQQEPVADAGDEEDDTYAAATTVGDDMLLEHGGNRFVLREDGGVVIDTRAGGRIALQASDAGLRLAAGGAIFDVGLGGDSVTVRAGRIEHDTGGGAAQATMRGNRFVEWLSSEAQWVASDGNSVRLVAPPPADVLQDAVKVS